MHPPPCARDARVMFEADLPELGVVKIATPCSQKWSRMEGNAAVRTCLACQSKVYNFAELTSEEARQLLRRNAQGQRICARLFKRLDGTVMTKDCARGYRYGWAVARRVLPRAGVVLLVLVAVAIGVATMFGDNIRRLFATSAGGMHSSPPIALSSPDGRGVSNPLAADQRRMGGPARR